MSPPASGWPRTAARRSPKSSNVKVCNEFDVEFDVAWRDALEFVLQLARHGILLVSGAALENAPAQAATPSNTP